MVGHCPDQQNEELLQMYAFHDERELELRHNICSRPGQRLKDVGQVLSRQ